MLFYLIAVKKSLSMKPLSHQLLSAIQIIGLKRKSTCISLVCVKESIYIKFSRWCGHMLKSATILSISFVNFVHYQRELINQVGVLRSDDLDCAQLPLYYGVNSSNIHEIRYGRHQTNLLNVIRKDLSLWNLTLNNVDDLYSLKNLASDRLQWKMLECIDWSNL